MVAIGTGPDGRGPGWAATLVDGLFEYDKAVVYRLRGAALGVGIPTAAAIRETNPLPPNGFLYLMAGWLGFVAGITLYWLVVGAVIPGRLLLCRRLRMVWIDPASTPAIRQLCRFHAFAAGALAVGVLISEVAAVLYAEGQKSSVAANFAIFFPIFAVTVALHVGLRPFILIARLVRRHIDLILSPVRAQIADPPKRLLESVGFEELVKVYQYFSLLRLLPIKTSALLQYVAGITASLLIYLVQKYLSVD